MRPSLVVASLCGAVGLAAAQPIDPYAPTAPSPPARDVELDTAVAAGLVARAEALVASGDDGNARILATEALAREPAAPVADRARALLAAIDARLIKALPPTVAPPTPRPAVPPAAVPVRPEPDDDPPVLDELPARPRGALALGFYGALGGAALGLGLSDDDGDGEPEALGAVAGGAVGGALAYGLARLRGYDAAAAHQLGSGLLWGGVAGALFADVVSGLEDTTATDLAIGAGAGAVGGAIIGLGLRHDDLTVGDAAVIDVSAALGTVVGLQLGAAMQPPETEAYTLNASLGAIAGYGVGHWLARRLDVSAGRAAKVGALGAIGAGAPWLLWMAVADDASDDDEQAFAWLSMAGLAGGLYLGTRWTRDDVGAGPDDAPPALVRRSSRGGWTLGGPTLTPTRGRGRGAVAPLVAGAW